VEALMLALVLSTAVLQAAEKHAVKAKVPKQAFEISLEIPGFKADKPDSDRTLLIGQTASRATISVLCENNYPYLSGNDCAQKHAKEDGFEMFKVGDVVCARWETTLHDVLKQTTWHAWPATSDFLFDIHASMMTATKLADPGHKFAKDDFIRIVKSWRTSGRVDRSAFVWPGEAYAFRDEASKASGDQLEWVSKQCATRGEEWPAHFYLGALAEEKAEPDAMVAGYSRAADLLGAMERRNAKQNHALVESLDRAAFALAIQRKFAEATPLCLRVLDVMRNNDAPELRAFREQALYNLASCYALTSQPDKALDSLRQALQAQPSLKQRAAKDETLASLHELPAFKSLVGR
jgi:tetratricopeptide (TPR) repeat protein